MSIGDPTKESWTEKAKCKIEQWDIHDADLTHIKKSERQAWAEHMCDGCPVMAQCSASAIELGSSGSVWGGTWIPESPYGTDDTFIHRLMLVKQTGEQPSLDEIEAHKRDHPLPKYFWVMNRPMADGGRTVPLGERPKHRVENCRAGHELTPDNIYSPPSRPNVRECRKCIHERHRRRQR